MSPPPPFCFSRSRREGSALIITLLFIVLVSIILVGFLMNVRVEGAAAAAHFERARASVFARTGVETAVATLGRYTSQITTNTGYYTTNGANFWISQPGQIIVGTTNSTPAQWLSSVVMLNSGQPSTSFSTNTSVDPSLLSANINIQTLASSTPATYLLCQGSTSMPLRWVYVRQDGSYDLPNPAQPISASNLPTESPVLNNTSNPIVGRFAYWTDDESNKINLNLAWKRNPPGSTSSLANTTPASDPSQVSLLGLTLDGSTPVSEADADPLHSWLTQSPARFFNSLLDANQVNSTVAQMVGYNRFSLTHYNHDPDTAYFGDDRIMLTTNRNLVPHVVNPATGQVVYLRRFLDIMRDDLPAGVTSLDPGNTDHIAGGQMVISNPGSPGSGTIQEMPNKIDATIRMLESYINRNDWPIAPSTNKKASSTSKYSTADAAQLAINIIDYVRAKESPSPLVAPLRVCISQVTSDTTNYGKYTISQNVPYGYYTHADMGVGRMPYITEMGAWVDANGGSPPNPPTPTPTGWPTDSKGKPANLYKLYLRAEVYLPSKYGVGPSGINLVPTTSTTAGAPAWFLTWPEFSDGSSISSSSNALDTYYWYNPDTNTAYNLTKSTLALPIFPSDIVKGSATLKPGQYTVIEKQVYCYFTSEVIPPGTQSRLYRNMRMTLTSGLMAASGLMVSDTIHDNGSLYSNQTSEQFTTSVSSTVADELKYATPDSTTVTKAQMNSVETDDPRASFNGTDWTVNASGNTFGTINSISTLGQPASGTVTPQQDTDAANSLTDASTYMPAPAGTVVTYADGTTDDNTLGRVTSLGELGYVYTGASTGTNTSGVKVPSTSYRTIRLQPNNYADTTTLPDWALLDLFSVPVVPNSTAVVPNTPTPLVNDNVDNPAGALYTPHGLNIGGRVNLNSHIANFSLTREDALVALLTNAPHLTSGNTASAIVANIYSGTLASANNNFGKSYGYASSKGYTGAYDMTGEICEIKGVADSGEQSEGLLRDIGSLITTRGNVFTVYTIGQALKQTPQGKLVITAENRQQVMVERYYDQRDTPTDPTDDTVHFRPIYSRVLTP